MFICFFFFSFYLHATTFATPYFISSPRYVSITFLLLIIYLLFTSDTYSRSIQFHISMQCFYEHKNVRCCRLKYFPIIFFLPYLHDFHVNIWMQSTFYTYSCFFFVTVFTCSFRGSLVIHFFPSSLSFAVCLSEGNENKSRILYTNLLENLLLNTTWLEYEKKKSKSNYTTELKSEKRINKY